MEDIERWAQQSQSSTEEPVESSMEMCMAKKSIIGEAIDAVKTVGGAALGAAASAATGVVMENVASAVTKTGTKLGRATPRLKRTAAETVSKPILPKKQKRAAAKRSAKKAKRKGAAVRAAKTRRTANSRKKR